MLWNGLAFGMEADVANCSHVRNSAYSLKHDADVIRFRRQGPMIERLIEENVAASGESCNDH